jgi:hypothetical protein
MAQTSGCSQRAIPNLLCRLTAREAMSVAKAFPSPTVFGPLGQSRKRSELALGWRRTALLRTTDPGGLCQRLADLGRDSGKKLLTDENSRALYIKKGGCKGPPFAENSLSVKPAGNLPRKSRLETYGMRLFRISMQP